MLDGSTPAGGIDPDRSGLEGRYVESILCVGGYVKGSFGNNPAIWRDELLLCSDRCFPTQIATAGNFLKRIPGDDDELMVGFQLPMLFRQRAGNAGMERARSAIL